MKCLAYLLTLWCSATTVAADITVFAAASLKEPLDQITAEVGGVTVAYGGSGTLARQVSLGAPADVVILANADWMDVLEDAEKISGRVDLLSNRLVVVSRESAPVDLTTDGLTTALNGGHLAMGFTASVPAGIYGKAALLRLDLWNSVAPQVAEVDSVRAALALVARGEAPLGIVYETDVRVAPDLHIAAIFPTQSHPPIRYVGALVQDTAKAAAFLDYLQSEHAQSIFISAGFLPSAP